MPPRTAAILAILSLLGSACRRADAPATATSPAGQAAQADTPAALPAPPTPTQAEAAAAQTAKADREAARQAAAVLARNNQLSPGFVAVPAGSFAMGRPSGDDTGYTDAPLHQVTITRPFEIKATEVTIGEYRELMATSPEQRGDSDDLPVAHTSWYQAITWCNALSRRHHFAPCYAVSGFTVTWQGLDCAGYRLPTEAEWEYAARAGTTAARPGPLPELGWFDENSGLRPHPVKQKRANAWGLYDMLGNVAEWVWDWRQEYPARPEVDPTGPKTGDNRVFRGGSFQYGEGEATAWARSAYGPPNQVPFIGFRCVRTLTGPTAAAPAAAVQP